MIDLNEELDPENLVHQHADANEEERLIDYNNNDNVNVNISTILQFNEELAKGKAIVCKSKHQRIQIVDPKNNNQTYIYSHPFQSYHLNALFLSRLWQTLQYLDSDLILYKSIFPRDIVTKKIHPTKMDCDSKCSAFLIHSTYDCVQQSFVTILAHL